MTLTWSTCGWKGCEEQMAGSTPKELERRMAAHRTSCHPDYVKPAPIPPMYENFGRSR